MGGNASQTTFRDLLTAVSVQGNAAHDHVSADHRRLRTDLLRPNARRRSNFKGHDAETLLGDPCFQHEPVHQHVELFAGPLEASTLWLLPEPLLLPQPTVAPPGPYMLFILKDSDRRRIAKKPSTVGRKNRPTRNIEVDSGDAG